jgi:hypothetical protein
MSGYFVGPIPPREFLDNFLPTKHVSNDESKNRWAELARKSAKGAMHLPFVSFPYQIECATSDPVAGQGRELSNY